MKRITICLLLLVVFTIGAPGAPLWKQVVHREKITAASVHYSESDSTYHYYYAVDGEGVFYYDGHEEKRIGPTEEYPQYLLTNVIDLLYIPDSDTTGEHLFTLNKDGWINHHPLNVPTDNWESAARGKIPAIVYDHRSKTVNYVSDFYHIRRIHVSRVNSRPDPPFPDADSSLFCIGQEDLYNSGIAYWKVLRQKNTTPGVNGYFKTEPDYSPLGIPKQILLLSSDQSEYIFSCASNHSNNIFEGLVDKNGKASFIKIDTEAHTGVTLSIESEQSITDITQVSRLIEATDTGWARESHFMAVSTTMGAFLIPHSALETLGYNLPLHELTDSELITHNPHSAIGYIKTLFDKNKETLFFINEEGIIGVSTEKETAMSTPNLIAPKAPYTITVKAHELFVTLPASSSGTLTLHTLQGRQLLSKDFFRTSTLTIPLAKRFSNGMYLLSITDKNNTFVTKLQVRMKN